MDIPLPIHVDKRGDMETLPIKDSHLVMQARSLRNTLGVILNRLRDLKSKEIHTFEDIEHYKYVLDKLEERWRDEEGTFAGHLATTDAPLATACSQLWTACYNLITEMEEEALEMPPDMRSIHSTLADLHRQLQELAEREHTTAEVSEIIKQLDAFDAVRQEHGGLFLGDIEAPPPGHAVCSEILAHNYELARSMMATAHDEPIELRRVADSLRSIRNDLKKLTGQKHHTTEDIAHYRFLTMAILSAQAEYSSEWDNSQAKKIAEECLNIVEQLQVSAEEMSVEMKKVYTELQNLKKVLNIAVSKAGRPSNEELKTWIHTADEIDDERAKSGGVFGGKPGDVGGVEAPAGQAVCTHLLEDCYKMLKELLEREVSMAPLRSLPKALLLAVLLVFAFACNPISARGLPSVSSRKLKDANANAAAQASAQSFNWPSWFPSSFAAAQSAAQASGDQVQTAAVAQAQTASEADKLCDLICYDTGSQATAQALSEAFAAGSGTAKAQAAAAAIAKAGDKCCNNLATALAAAKAVAQSSGSGSAFAQSAAAAQAGSGYGKCAQNALAQAASLSQASNGQSAAQGAALASASGPNAVGLTETNAGVNGGSAYSSSSSYASAGGR